VWQTSKLMWSVSGSAWTGRCSTNSQQAFHTSVDATLLRPPPLTIWFMAQPSLQTRQLEHTTTEAHLVLIDTHPVVMPEVRIHGGYHRARHMYYRTHRNESWARLRYTSMHALNVVFNTAHEGLGRTLTYSPCSLANKTPSAVYHHTSTHHPVNVTLAAASFPLK
jgi:hypothetical protein